MNKAVEATKKIKIAATVKNLSGAKRRQITKK